MYRDDRRKMVEEFEKVYDKSINQAAAEEARLAIKAGKFIVHNGQVLPCIAVMVDGSWGKRSFASGQCDSLSGAALIIWARTGKIVWAGVRNKACIKCADRIKNGLEGNHLDCLKNWGRNQVSTAMEADIIAEGFRNSVSQHDLIYSVMIGDGDSSTYKTIKDLHV